ncbi:sugar 3,4-ketoisomerase [Variovorax sp. PBS-H4]|uniref:sugar 3,4-ketoisomerase n=1 Tax=Variovorax sp. PBS-H4 TaxID=434008 RepID=UPI001E64028B|nr:FdtA/QdtA family cupin domain-containing protein [Variovorax sp. PBS-H4]
MLKSLDEEISIVDLTKITDPRGSLTFIEGEVHIPFPVRRVYYLYDVTSGSARAGHAHFALEQLVIAVSGSFDLVLDNGYDRRTITCNRPWIGVHMKSLIWRDLNNFSSGAVCLVLASERYAEPDYIRNYDSFLEVIKQRDAR